VPAQVPFWQVSPVVQALPSSHAAPSATQAPARVQQPSPGQGLAPEQAVQALLTQIGVAGLPQSPHSMFCPQRFGTVPHMPAVHGSSGVQPHWPGIPPPPQV
jgi:hypothetical protein